jgi:hypothetical protein
MFLPDPGGSQPAPTGKYTDFECAALLVAGLDERNDGSEAAEFEVHCNGYDR